MNKQFQELSKKFDLIMELNTKTTKAEKDLVISKSY